MKKHFLIPGFLFLFVFWAGLASEKQQKVIAFDLHGVVLHYDWGSLIPALWYSPYKWQALKKIYALPVFALITMIWSKPSFEQVLALCGRDNPAFRELLIDLSAQQKLSPAVADIIKELFKRENVIHVLSNIGAESYQRIATRYADTFHCFSAVMTSLMYDEHDVLIKKPDPRYFEYYFKQQGVKPEDVLFVDDREKNVTIARSLGMEVILYKNAEQLQKELEDRNLL